MSIHIHGTYKSGVIYPEQPLALPDDTKISIVVTPTPEQPSAEVPREQPAAPRISREELEERIARYGVSVGSLPPDFSRDDIYSDHD
jgi:hypothetical protein